MKQLDYQVHFNTPAFLGNAEQVGQWRTPPFKAQLRQWWRVAYAAAHDIKVNLTAMRHEEGRLFGHAWLADDQDDQGHKVAARKSLVRLRLAVPHGDAADAWSLGSQQGVTPLSTDLNTSYAWFGLVKRGKGQPDRTAIKAGSDKKLTRALRIACPDLEAERMAEVLRLIETFGLLGSRSRGGWGALHIDGVLPLSGAEMRRYARPLADCLRQDWAMSLASDAQGALCVWTSANSYPSWDKAMREVASLRKTTRSALKPEQGPDLRSALGFAATGRMPSPLRWKIVPAAGNALAIRVFALPHKLPADSGKSMTDQALQDAWRTVCATLDEANPLRRLAAEGSQWLATRNMPR